MTAADGESPDSPPAPERETRHTARSVRLGLLLAVVGGALDAYTFVDYQVFANAQTGNIVMMGVSAAQRDWRAAADRLPPILAFVAGVVAAEALQRPRISAILRWPTRMALVLEILVLIGVALLPREAQTVVTVLVAFASSVQVTSFRTLVDTPYSTTISTGNLRTAAQNAFAAVVARDREAARRAGRFWGIVLAFLVGACGGAVLTMHLHAYAVLVPAVLLIGALALFVHDERTA
ncbi:YoaK family protein [Nocardia alni]|uniref:YoaK family protein n=1 Tax=Nocardia alni TaxID=2815723 RepID=UPI001C210CFC|nr:YoaK family protein [Nocardia alni]